MYVNAGLILSNVILEFLLHVREEGLRRYVSGVKGGTHRIHLRYAVVNRRVGQLRNFQPTHRPANATSWRHLVVRMVRNSLKQHQV